MIIIYVLLLVVAIAILSILLLGITARITNQTLKDQQEYIEYLDKKIQALSIELRKRS